MEKIVAQSGKREGFKEDDLLKKTDFTPEYVYEKLLEYVINHDFPDDELSEIGSKVMITDLADLEINSVKKERDSFIVDGQCTLETETDMGEGDTSDGAYPMTFVYEFDNEGKIVRQVRRQINTSKFFE
jgi:hypothetical protein